MSGFTGLFGTAVHKLVRRDDPDTSHEAAQKVDTTKLEAEVYAAIKTFGVGGCISDQLLDLFPRYPYSSVTARYRALLDKDLIEIIGTRRCRSGRSQRIMRAK